MKLTLLIAIGATLILCLLRPAWAAEKFSNNYVCHEDINCRRQIDPAIPDTVSMGACRLTCGLGQTLLPYPTGNIEISKGLDVVNLIRPPQMYLENDGGIALLENSENLVSMIFGEISKARSPINVPEIGKPFHVHVNITNPSMVLDYDTDESYQLKRIEKIDEVIVYINAETYFGMKNAIITLSQLIIYDDIQYGFKIPKSFSITDKPKYPHRSVMIDSGHMFLSIESIERLMLGLVQSKINRLHWHISDAQSFPLHLFSHPELAAYGAYAKSTSYNVGHVARLNVVARLLGIQIIPEIPIPSPMGSGWTWGPGAGLGDLVVCHNQKIPNPKCQEPPCGQLNIMNGKAIEVVLDVYKELANVFGVTTYHLGGMELDAACFPGASEYDLMQRWMDLLKQVRDTIVTAQPGSKVIIFSSEYLQTKMDMLSPSDFIIQLRERENGTLLKKLASLGFKVILSPHDLTRWDCGYGQWSPYQRDPECSRILGWQAGYSIVSHRSVAEGVVIGGEGLLYSGQTQSFSLEEKLLTKAAALSERFWTDPMTWTYLEAFPRMAWHAERMQLLGFHREAIQPYWCLQMVGKCLIGE